MKLTSFNLKVTLKMSVLVVKERQVYINKDGQKLFMNFLTNQGAKAAVCLVFSLFPVSILFNLQSFYFQQKP